MKRLDKNHYYVIIPGFLKKFIYLLLFQCFRKKIQPIINIFLYLLCQKIQIKILVSKKVHMFILVLCALRKIFQTLGDNYSVSIILSIKRYFVYNEYTNFTFHVPFKFIIKHQLVLTMLSKYMLKLLIIYLYIKL